MEVIIYDEYELVGEEWFHRGSQKAKKDDEEEKDGVRN